MLSLVIHGHFYQPPRENPWLDEVETEPSAAPYHDWNQRIERECYRAVIAARILGAGGRIARVVNALEWMSFNYGPTLLEWMEREAPDTYETTIAADRASVARLGHGNAIAQPYHHAILPLATRRDKVTEVRWGITDFRRRYGRDPEGMWLPETAVDDETLDVLASEGIRFTILAPHQVAKAPPGGLPGRYVTSGRREIALFPYNGDISHGIAFGGLLNDSMRWVARLEELDRAMIAQLREAEALAPAGAGGSAAAVPAASAEHRGAGAPGDEARLLSVATDGESYGHHHKFGEMALAHMLQEMGKRGAVIENFASFLARHPAVHDVELVEPTSWSCAHGVERWRSNCGCRVNGAAYPSQAWRTPLRDGLNELASGLHTIFVREGAAFFESPWDVRDAYGTVVSATDERTHEAFARRWCKPGLSAHQLVRARELLEMERDALRMFTSCAWFFDDIGGIEAQQVLRYAARAVSLAGPERAALEEALMARLATAESNDRAVGTGRDVYLTHARPRHRYFGRIAAAELACHALDVPYILSFPAAAITIDGDQVTVTERRTGRVHRFTGAVDSRTASDIRVSVTPLGDDGSRGAARVYTLRDFPERARRGIRSVLRHELLPRALTSEELRLLASGDVPLRALVRVALTRNVARLGSEGGADTIALVDALIDLCEQQEEKIPFDAQTAFWRVWETASPAMRLKLAGLRRRLGFVEQDGEHGGEGPGG